MSNKLYQETAIQDIADAIREKGGTGTYTVNEMGTAIRNLPTGGDQPQLYAPSISISSDYLHITPSESNGDFNSGSTYQVYEGSTLLVSTSDTEILLHNYIDTDITHTFYVKQSNTNFLQSADSNTATWVRRDGLAITASEGTLSVIIQAGITQALPMAIHVWYKLDDADWVDWFTGSEGNSTQIDIPNGSTLLLWNENQYWSWAQNRYAVINIFSNDSGKATLAGTINALINGTTITNKTYVFYKLFADRTAIISANGLTLPGLSIQNYGYCSMFENCTSLIDAPDLPATTLTEGCYSYMFSGCTSLSQAPSSLPAYGALPTNCYQYMFKNCTSLVNAPYRFGSTQHPTVNIGIMSCYGMFNGCSSLITPPLFGGNSIGNNGCYRMFLGCSSLRVSTTRYYDSLGQFTMIPQASSIGENGVTNMFQGCQFRGDITWSETGTPDAGIFLYYNNPQE